MGFFVSEDFKFEDGLLGSRLLLPLLDGKKFLEVMVPGWGGEENVQFKIW